MGRLVFRIHFNSPSISRGTIVGQWNISSVPRFTNIGYRNNRSTKETLDVPVVTYGQAGDFPAFYDPWGGFKAGTYSTRYHSVN